MASTVISSGPARASRIEEINRATIRVAHLPVYPENPYQPLLFSSLAQHDVAVIQGGGGGNFFRTARNKWNSRLLHFHWLHPYIVRPSAIGTALRGVRFVAEIAALKRAGKRLVWTVHNLQNHDGRHVGLERLVSGRFAALADAIIVHSKFAGRAAVERFSLREQEKITVIPHGNYIPQYGELRGRLESRQALGLPQQAVIFLLFGRLHAYKGVLRLLETFSHLTDNSVLILAGSPVNSEAEALLRQKCGTNQRIVLRPCYVPDDEVSTYFSACSAVVLPYHDVLTSGAAILAMSFGKACIAPRMGSLPETFAPEGAFLYEPDEAGGLLSAMRRALLKENELDRMGAANLERAREWDWDRIADKTRNVYERCLSI